MKATLSIILCLLFTNIHAQEPSMATSATDPKNGSFSLGIRSTQSLFGSSGYPGMGFGGQFRIRLGKKLNTEWFADHIKTDLGGVGHRETAHIGWSVMFYPLNSEIKKGALLPYILAGHCFDFAKINGYQHKGDATINTEFETKRWTSAVQVGLGASYHLTDRFDISFSAQYMSHLGNELHAQEAEALNGIGNHLFNDTDQNQLALEGHLLLAFSLNYIIASKSNLKS